MIEHAETALTKATKGGIARAKSMTKAQRSASATKAANARWTADLPQASHDGFLTIGKTTLLAANLASGRRLVSQGSFLTAIGRSRTPKAGTGGTANVDGLPFFLQADILKSFISDDLRLSTTPVFFKLRSGQRTVGYDANLLTGVCRVYQKLHQSLTNRMQSGEEPAKAKAAYQQYRHIISACDELMGNFADRGIEALVDDATGYQAEKARDEALKIVQQYVSPQYLIPWTEKFTSDFFRGAYKILGWEYKVGTKKHPQFLGKFIIKYVYAPLPPGVLEELKRKLPKNEHGNRKAKLWQALTPGTGIPHLDRQLTTVNTIMELSDGKAEFEQNFNKIFGHQRFLPLGHLLKED